MLSMNIPDPVISCVSHKMEISTNYEAQINDYIQDSYEFVDPINLVNSVYNVFCKLKDQNRLTQCSGCKRFKHAGTKCRNETCAKYNATEKCKICKRGFVKQGNHKCLQNKSLAIKSKTEIFDKIVVNKENKTCGDLDDTKFSYSSF